MAIVNLAKAQRTFGYDVTVAISARDVEGYLNYPEYLATLKRNGIRVLKVESTFYRDINLNLNAVESICDYLNSNMPSIIHTHAAVPSLIGILISFRFSSEIPVLQTMHGWGLNKTPEQSRFDIRIMNCVDRVVVPALSNAAALTGMGVNPQRISIIPYGLTLGLESVAEPPQEIIVLKKEGCRVLCCVGSVGSRKNQKLLVEALPAVLSYCKAACIFVGEGNEVAMLRKRAHQLNIAKQVWFIGHRSKGSRYIHHSDIFVLPSRSEGLPLSILEAFRSGIPVVASKIPGITDIIIDHETGFLFPSGHKKALEESLLKALSLEDKDRKELAERTRSLIKEKYNFKSMMQSYLEQYQIIKNKRTNHSFNFLRP